MKLFDVVGVGLAVAGALTYLVIHFLRPARRFKSRASCAGCVAAADGTVHRTSSNGCAGTGCPGCG
jgi:hypothetical protein